MIDHDPNPLSGHLLLHQATHLRRLFQSARFQNNLLQSLHPLLSSLHQRVQQHFKGRRPQDPLQAGISQHLQRHKPRSKVDLHLKHRAVHPVLILQAQPYRRLDRVGTCLVVEEGLPLVADEVDGPLPVTCLERRPFPPQPLLLPAQAVGAAAFLLGRELPLRPRLRHRHQRQAPHPPWVRSPSTPLPARQPTTPTLTTTTMSTTTTLIPLHITIR